MKIYLVLGETGEYEEFQGWWAIKAFAKEADANNFCSRLNRECAIATKHQDGGGEPLEGPPDYRVRRIEYES